MNNTNLLVNMKDKRFIKLYDDLFIGKYKSLNNNDRMVYCELVNRSHLSLTNGWVDDEGIFVKYSQNNLAEKTCVTVNTVKKSLTKLEEIGLIKVVQQGANLPNKIYVFDSISEGLKNNTSGIKNSHLEISKNGYEKDYLKTNNKDYINIDANAQKNKPRTNYKSGNYWIYSSYMSFNKIDKIVNETDYYNLNKLVDDFDNNHIKYYFSRGNKGGFKNTKYIRGVLKKWSGKSIAQIEFEEKQYYEQQKQLNDKYVSVSNHQHVALNEPKRDYNKLAQQNKVNKSKDNTVDIHEMLEEIYG